ncbi:MAG: hypothetical protein JW785_00375 [Acidimicrobiia bacterium]|nr:hypothetical protein [Acidimicrobiia bacterium]
MPADPATSGESAAAPLLILGGHRSGTSLVSGLFWHAGLHMGELLPGGPDNPRGFFESVQVLAAHRALLAAQERDWTCPPHRLDPHTCDLGPLAEVIRDLAARGRPWGVKDPRLLFLLPAWVEILPAMRLIGVLRHPASVAASLTARNGFAPPHARAVADANLTRLAALQQALGFPVLDYDGPGEALLAGARSAARAMGLEWDEAAAAALFDPGLRHQAARGPGGPAYDALLAAAAETPALSTYQAWEVATALAALPDRADEAVPLAIGPAFLRRRAALWGFRGEFGPELGRVLEVAPPGAPREPLLDGVDRAEIDLAVGEEEGEQKIADPVARYSHVLLTGIAETLDRVGLTALLSRLGAATTSDAVALFDDFVVEGMTLPPVKRWGRLSATTSRRGPLHHHHLAEIETAALEADWLVGEVALSSDGRSRVRLVKSAQRRSPGWVTSAERRATLAIRDAQIESGQQRIAELQAHISRLGSDAEKAAAAHAASIAAAQAEGRARLERERQRNRMAYDALLKENADIRHMYHEKIGALKDEVRRLRRLRSVRGWLGFQARRLSPSHVAAAFRRRRHPRTG